MNEDINENLSDTSDLPLLIPELQLLAVDLEKAIFETNVELSVSQLSDSELFLFQQLPNQLWLKLDKGNLAAALHDAEDLKHKAEKFVYMVDEQEVLKKARHLLNEIVFASEHAG